MCELGWKKYAYLLLILKRDMETIVSLGPLRVKQEVLVLIKQSKEVAKKNVKIILVYSKGNAEVYK